MAMTKELKDKWVAALRSGQFIQGLGFLEVISPEGVPRNCCLGVLCRITGITGTSSPYGQGTPIFFKRRGEGSSTVLTTKMLRYFGLTDKQQRFLAAVNDGESNRKQKFNLAEEQWDFNKIATWIETNIRTKKAA